MTISIPHLACTLATALLLFQSFVAPGHAAVFYVDSVTGRDTWSGRAPDPRGSPATDGPWASLTRVAAQTLAPGDEIRLRCGRQWAETLRINQSGTDAAPILISTYPSNPCTAKPLIRGGARIPAHVWSVHQGNAYRASWPLNLVENGSLAQSITRWTRWSVLGGETIAFNPGCAGNLPCLDFTSAPGQWSLIISPNFRIDAGTRYTVSFSVLAPRGVNLVAVLRRGGPTNYDALGLNATVTGTGTWQTQSYSVTSTQAADNARFDLYVAGNRVRVQLRDVRVQPAHGNPVHVFMDDRPLQPAHHPNFGHDPADLGLIYLKNGATSDTVATAWGTGSTYLTTGPDLRLPVGAGLSPGLTAHMRTQPYKIDRRFVTRVDGTRLMFSTPTTYPFRKDWGYFLTGAAWMVDSPDEWQFDTTSRQLLTWMPDSMHPGDRLSYTILPVGIDLQRLGNIVVDGLAISGTVTGVSFRSAQSVVLRNLRIEDVQEHGVAALDSNNCRVEQTDILMTGLDAIAGGDTAENLTVQDNRISASGALTMNGIQSSLPAPSLAAIRAGPGAIIRGNTVDGTAYHAIRANRMSVIAGNAISNACLMLDDCAGIYTWMSADHIIENNVIRNLPGNRQGTPLSNTHAVGIYLDDLSSGTTVRNNTVTNADYGIQVHNAYDNTISENTLYGNRRLQLWFQEQTRSTRPEGDIRGNRVERNTMVPTTGSVALLQESVLGDTADFAAYTGNIWSALLSPRIASESWPGGGATYTFAEWKNAAAAGIPRALDSNGLTIGLGSFSAYRVLGANAVPNGGLDKGTTGWTWWNRTAPTGTLVWERCLSGPCLRFVAGASESLLSTPNFSVTKDQWYRVSFDVRSPAGSQSFSVVARRGGGGTAGYEDLMASSESYTAGNQWTRYSFAFKAAFSVTANDPVTKELGARIDFHRIAPGRTIYLANVEMVPLSPADNSVKTALLLNPDTRSPSIAECPDAVSAPARCPHYRNLLDGSRITWPRLLGPLDREVVYARDESLIDTDQDGISDSEDACPGTLLDSAVNSIGCPL